METNEPQAPPVLPSEASITRLADAMEHAYPSAFKTLVRSFFNGIATGLGATLGVTLTMSFLAWSLNALGYFEALKPFTAAVQKVISSPQSSSPRLPTQ
jgi:hypothetical protein